MQHDVQELLRVLLDNLSEKMKVVSSLLFLVVTFDPSLMEGFGTTQLLHEYVHGVGCDVGKKGHLCHSGYRTMRVFVVLT